MDGREITARTISDILQGKEDPDKPKTLIEVFTEHNVQVHQVRDIFVFCTYTGLAFSDVKTLKPEHIKEDNEGQLWLRKPRQKTGVMCNIPLIPPAIKLIEKYKEHPHCVINEVVMPVFSNICMNDYLRDIAKLCEFTKPLTCHQTRHTAATVVFLANKVNGKCRQNPRP